MPTLVELSPHEIDDLTEAVLQCPKMQTARGREDILSDLRTSTKTVDDVRHADDNKTHARNIVFAFRKNGDWVRLVDRVLFYYGEQKDKVGLIQLRRELEQQLFDSRSLLRLKELLDQGIVEVLDTTRIFRECAANLITSSDERPEKPYEMLLILAGFQRQSSNFPFPALRFAEKVAGLFAAPVARQIREVLDQIAAAQNVADALSSLRAGMAWRTTTGMSTLVYEIRQKGEGFAILASFLDAGGSWTTFLAEDSPVSEAAVRSTFRELVMRAEEQSTELVIEFALPRHLLFWAVDQWDIDVGGYSVAAGTQHPVVLRWVDRFGNKNLEPRWREKWKSIKSHSGKPLWLTQGNQYQPRKLLAILGQSPHEGAFIGFAFTPSRASEPSGDPLSVALSGGTPIAIWWRECDPDPQKAQEELRQLLTHESLLELPTHLKGIRNAAEREGIANHPGSRIALLYDDYDRRPPRLGDQKEKTIDDKVADLQR
jgi:hypothetical protein